MPHAGAGVTFSAVRKRKGWKMLYECIKAVLGADKACFDFAPQLKHLIKQKRQLVSLPAVAAGGKATKRGNTVATSAQWNVCIALHEPGERARSSDAPRRR